MGPKTFRVLAAVVAWALVAIPATAGSVSGTATVARGGSPSGTVVWLEAPNIAARAPEAHAVMDQKEMHFLPHVLAVQVGTTVDFENHDTVVHNVFSPDACAGSFNLGNWGPGGVRSHIFDRTCRATILCSLHADMEAWIAVVPTPYFAVTGAQGHFTITDVPAGDYTLKAWNPDASLASSSGVEVRGDTVKDLTLG